MTLPYCSQTPKQRRIIIGSNEGIRLKTYSKISYFFVKKDIAQLIFETSGKKILSRMRFQLQIKIIDHIENSK